MERLTAGYCRLVRYIVVAQPVPSTPLRSARQNETVQVRQLHHDESSLLSFPRQPQVFANRFAQGATVYGAFDGDKPVGFIWFTRSTYHEDEVHCAFRSVPEEETAWDFDVYVMPSYRFTSVFAKLWDAACAHMREAGVHWTMSRISAFNAHSIAAHRRLGAIKRGVLNFLCIGPVQLYIGTLPPRVRISCGERGKPILCVDSGSSLESEYNRTGPE